MTDTTADYPMSTELDTPANARDADAQIEDINAAPPAAEEESARVAYTRALYDHTLAQLVAARQSGLQRSTLGSRARAAHTQTHTQTQPQMLTQTQIASAGAPGPDTDGVVGASG